MNNILRDEVNQHTSDEVAKVLADLEAQGVDLAALQAALTAQGANINTILQKVQNSGGGLQLKSVQRGTIAMESDEKAGTATISSVNVNKALVFNLGSSWANISSASMQPGHLSYLEARVELTNATTVTATRGRKDMTAPVVAFQVVEFA